MSNQPVLQKCPAGFLPQAGDSERKLKFSGCNAFHLELRRRVDEFFRSSGRRRRDCPKMYLKTTIILTGFAAFYAALVFAVNKWWLAVPLAMLLGFSAALIGFNIEHDGSHQAYSDHAWINKFMAMTLDLVGGSSYIWRWKHVVFHHMYVNINGHDTDIDLGVFGRLHPHGKSHGYHRWQHWYLWPLYGVMAIKWHFHDDFHDLLTGRMGENSFPRPTGWELGIFLAGKLSFFALAFGIPLLFHPLWVVVLFYGVTASVLGVVLSVVFQLAHAVEQAEFPLPLAGSVRIENAWAVHQVESTVNFARHNPLATWLVGGLNFQIEHHLFPRICHTNYPAISKLVENTCREYGVRYAANASFRSGLASHYRWLRRMGLPNPV
ncbi:MAG: fatty acid desaturase family protein [Gammaproteobacteria bacterium]